MRTHCQKGHELTPENTQVCGKYIRCKVCKKLNQRTYKRRSREARQPLATYSKVQAKLPVEPLLAALAMRPDAVFHENDLKLISRARRTGVLGEAAADRIACAIGLHPCLIWGNEWFEVAA